VIRRLLALAALVASPVAAQQQGPDPAEVRARVERTLVASGFQGVYAVALGGERVAGGAVGTADAAGTPFAYEAIFPWASVTKQVVATLVMEQVDGGRIALDAPASRYLPALGGTARAPTVRELLQHRSGLPNPADGPAADEAAPVSLAACLAPRGAPGGQWRYNNCDYVLLGAILERVTRRPLPALFAERIGGASGTGALFLGADGADARTDAEWAGGPTAAERAILARFGAAGGMVGTAEDLLAFDRALLRGTLLTDAARRTMWAGDGRLGSMALGQWSFAAPLAGCAAPVQIVERRGQIGRFQARNILLPQLGAAVVLLTNRGEQEFGEIWQGRGLSYDVLAAVACA
jgi:D-alanyl-D-alanine carboxypeptidase